MKSIDIEGVAHPGELASLAVARKPATLLIWPRANARRESIGVKQYEVAAPATGICSLMRKIARVTSDASTVSWIVPG